MHERNRRNRKTGKLRGRGVLTDQEFVELKTYTLSLDNDSQARKDEIKPNPEPKTEPLDKHVKAEISPSLEEYKPAGIVKAHQNNVNSDAIPLENGKPNNSAPSGNKWLIGIAGLMVLAVCTGLGFWIAHNNNKAAELKAEAEKKQAAANEEYAKLDAKLKKLEADLENRQKTEASSKPDTNSSTADQSSASATPQEQPALPPVIEKSKSGEIEKQTTSASADLIQYDSPATPLVIQMIDGARDTEKLVDAKNRLAEIGRPAKGDRKAARKLNEAAITLMGEKKYAEAIPVLQEAHATDPSDIEIMNNLGYAYIEQGIADNNFGKAKEALVDTLRLKPERAQAWANLGKVFALEGNENAAANCYVNFFRFAENKEKALNRLQEGINETNPELSKALSSAYSFVKANIQPEAPAAENSQEIHR